jgi:CheY-like chemotaxis protein
MNILIVDDNPVNRQILSISLSDWGHFAREAESGQQAIDACVEEMPELILMDVMMPGMDGMEASRQIRALPGGADISILFVTAIAEDEGLVNALQAGGDDYLTKPVDLDMLQAKMAAHQRIRDLSRQLAEKNRLLEEHNEELRHEQQVIGHFFDRIQEQNYLPGDRLCVHTSAMTTFSGDVLLSRERPGGGLYVMLGDFTGHGLTAAIGSLPTAEIFARMADQGASAGAIAREINKVLSTYLPVEIFLAAIIIELQADLCTLDYWAGGLPPGVARLPDGELLTLNSQHIALGILNDTQFNDRTEHLELPAGSHIFLMSDGITEATAADGEMFGEARVEQLIRRRNGGEETLRALIEAARDFAGTELASDDLTLAAITCRKPAR